MGKVCLLDIDVQGARAVRRSSIPCVLVFIMPPSLSVLEARLRGRGTETEEVIASRLANAREEIRSALDRSEALFNVILVNDDLQETYSLLKSLIARLSPPPRGAGGAAQVQVPLVAPAAAGGAAPRLAGADGRVVLTAGRESYALNLSALGGSAPGYTTGGHWEELLRPAAI